MWRLRRRMFFLLQRISSKPRRQRGKQEGVKLNVLNVPIENCFLIVFKTKSITFPMFRDLQVTFNAYIFLQIAHILTLHQCQFTNGNISSTYQVQVFSLITTLHSNKHQSAYDAKLIWVGMS